MVDLAMLVRRDKGLEVNESSIRQEVTRVMALEKELANVSSEVHFFLFFYFALLGQLQGQLGARLRG